MLSMKQPLVLLIFSINFLSSVLLIPSQISIISFLLLNFRFYGSCRGSAPSQLGFSVLLSWFRGGPVPCGLSYLIDVRRVNSVCSCFWLLLEDGTDDYNLSAYQDGNWKPQIS